MHVRIQGHDKSYCLNEQSVMDLVHESNVTKDHEFIVSESQLIQLFKQCHSCGLEVKLKTSI